MENLMTMSIGTQDGHGGRAEEHRKEIEEIAEKVVNLRLERFTEEIKEMILVAQYQAYEQALKDVIGVLEYDIQSVTKIGIEGCREIFEGEKAQKFISDQIVKRIVKELKNKTFKP